MSTAFYFDENIPSAIAAGLRRLGVDALTVQDDGRDGLEDALVMDRAGELVRLVFTHDEDFVVEAARRLNLGEPFAGIVFAHQPGPTIGRCVQDLELIAKASDFDEFANRVVFLPL